MIGENELVLSAESLCEIVEEHLHRSYTPVGTARLGMRVTAVRRVRGGWAFCVEGRPLPQTFKATGDWQKPTETLRVAVTGGGGGER